MAVRKGNFVNSWTRGDLYVTRVDKYESANQMIWKTQYYMEVPLSIPAT